MSGVPVPDGLSDAFSRVFAQVVEERFSAIPVTACLVWHIEHTPDAALLHIAQQLGLRRVLGASSLRSALPRGRSLLARRGTRGGVRAAIEALGYQVTLTNRLQHERCDGSFRASGEPHRCGSDAHWAVCRVTVLVPSVNGAQATLGTEQIREVWSTLAYFGRRSIRYVVVLRDGAGLRVFREGALVSEPTHAVGPLAFDSTFDDSFE